MSSNRTLMAVLAGAGLVGTAALLWINSTEEKNKKKQRDASEPELCNDVRDYMRRSLKNTMIEFKRDYPNAGFLDFVKQQFPENLNVADDGSLSVDPRLEGPGWKGLFDQVSSTDSTEVLGPPPGSGHCELVSAHAAGLYFVRHGERVDEVNDEWVKTAGDRWFDPPLSEDGVEMARRTALHLLKDHQNDPFDLIVASPLLRTMQTAEQFGEVLGLPVKPVAALAACALFVREGGGLSAFIPLSVPGAKDSDQRSCPTGRFLTIAEFSITHKRCPHVKFQPTDWTSEPFVKGCASHAFTEKGRKQRLLLVTHREGMSEIAAHAPNFTAQFPAPPYCAVLRMTGTTAPNVSLPSDLKINWTVESIQGVRSWVKDNKSSSHQKLSEDQNDSWTHLWSA